jgi:hypothetical protein
MPMSTRKKREKKRKKKKTDEILFFSDQSIGKKNIKGPRKRGGPLSRYPVNNN